MAKKQVVFLCLVTVGLVASNFNGCDVVANQTIAFQNCTLEPHEVPKVDGYCPMSDYVIPIPVCDDVHVKFCHQVVTRDLEENCMTHTIQHCVTSYEKHSVAGVEVRRRSANDKCKIEKATCNDNSVVVPQNVTYN